MRYQQLQRAAGKGSLHTIPLLEPFTARTV